MRIKIEVMALACWMIAGLTGCTVIQVGSAQPAQSSTQSTTYVSVHDKVPVIPLPLRPMLETLTENEKVEFGLLSDGLQKKLNGNSKALQTYAKQLDASIEIFNNWAKTQNELNEGKK